MHLSLKQLLKGNVALQLVNIISIYNNVTRKSNKSKKFVENGHLGHLLQYMATKYI